MYQKQKAGANIIVIACLGQNIARMEMLHAVARFFTQIPDAKLADTVTEESMILQDFFILKRKGGRLEITTD